MTSALINADVVGGASARGFSHIHRNKPNQDAHGGWTFGRWSVLAVSDGHGGDAYFRSERGSRFAVEAVRATFAWLSSNGTADAAALDRLHKRFVDLPERIVSHWRQAVTADIAADPDRRLPESNPQIAYGATCIAAAFGPGVSMFFQIGDGDLLVATPNGNLTKPLPDDDGLIGEQTYSLCLDDAVSHFRTQMFASPHPLATTSFAMASSDGLSKSFTKEAQFFDTAQHWRLLVEQSGMSSACRNLEAWLAKCSEMGSGDDITLMMFHAAEARLAVAQDERTRTEMATVPAPLAPSNAAPPAPTAGAAKPTPGAHPPNLPSPAPCAGARRGVRTIGTIIVAAVAIVALGAGALYLLR